ncbi:MAG: penicillin-binding protein 2 [Anaerolineales bacterium]|nr:penicillin-binding protein 2 [Chloroflexota bacterium]MBL6980566.1 penicillin-binding protein 2 [Anaerolineales bacterium]
MMEKHRFRYATLGIVFAIFGIAIILRLFQIQVGAPNEKIQVYEDFDGKEWVTLTPARGDIYDRHGSLLAGSQLIYEVAIELNEVINPTTIALVTSVELELNYHDVFLKANQKASEAPKTHITLNYFVSYEKAQKLMELQNQLYENPKEAGASNDGIIHSLSGLVITPRLDRSYPEGDLASNVIGLVDKEGSSHNGVEERLQWLLSGVEKQEIISADPYRAMDLPEITDGASLVLTIDREIQDAMEELLEHHMGVSGAYAGSIIVMHPRTGEILAMTSTPRLDLSGEWNVDEIYQEGHTFNMAIDGYEPGSVFKIITMAAALDSGVATPETPFTDTGGLEVEGWTIRNWNGGAWGPQTMKTCMEHSLNVCLAYIATELLGQNRFYDYVRAFQFGQPTGIELAWEYGGNVRFNNEDDWHLIDLATNSYGQGIEVTPIQMLRAVSAVANDGKMVTPHILKAVINNGHQYTFEPEVAGSPISKQTAHTLSNMLAQIVESESYTDMPENYRVAGKTGTATIYNDSRTNTSFIGWGPVDDPQFMVYIWLNKPTSSQWASLVTGPIFRDVVERLVILMDIPPDHVRHSLTAD